MVETAVFTALITFTLREKNEAKKKTPLFAIFYRHCVASGGNEHRA